MKQSTTSYAPYREPLYERPVFQYAKFVLILATLAVGILILLKAN
ncbi:MAG: hypothetical protein Q8R04_04365 [Nanoarchaeota archaeon]|nr:hypothetical protein [Nanoarchaeota archaeon]